MASRDTLLRIVENGSNLVLLRSVPIDLLRQLVETAARAGGHVTVSARLPAEVVEELASNFGKAITFVHGIADYKKD